MLPVLYNKLSYNTKWRVDSGVIGILGDAISCKVTEERNGQFELEMEYPMTGRLFHDIKVDCIIYTKCNEATDDSSMQPFLIYDISKPMKGKIKINAHHISYELSQIPVGYIDTSDMTAKTAVNKIKDAVTLSKDGNTDKFNYNIITDIDDGVGVQTFGVEIPISVRSVIGGDNGFLDIFMTGDNDSPEPEVKWDKYNVYIYRNRGNGKYTDADSKKKRVSIRYGKNLQDLTQEENIENTWTGIQGYFSGTDPLSGNEIRKIGKIQYCSNYKSFSHPRILLYDIATGYADNASSATNSASTQVRSLDDRIHEGYYAGPDYYPGVLEDINETDESRKAIKQHFGFFKSMTTSNWSGNPNNAKGMFYYGYMPFINGDYYFDTGTKIDGYYYSREDFREFKEHIHVKGINYSGSQIVDSDNAVQFNHKNDFDANYSGFFIDQGERIPNPEYRSSHGTVTDTIDDTFNMDSIYPRIASGSNHYFSNVYPTCSGKYYFDQNTVQEVYFKKSKLKKIFDEEYVKTNDTTPIEGKSYFVKDDSDGDQDDEDEDYTAWTGETFESGVKYYELVVDTASGTEKRQLNKNNKKQQLWAYRGKSKSKKNRVLPREHVFYVNRTEGDFNGLVFTFKKTRTDSYDQTRFPQAGKEYYNGEWTLTNYNYETIKDAVSVYKYKGKYNGTNYGRNHINNSRVAAEFEFYHTYLKQNTGDSIWAKYKMKFPENYKSVYKCVKLTSPEYKASVYATGNTCGTAYEYSAYKFELIPPKSDDPDSLSNDGINFIGDIVDVDELSKSYMDKHNFGIPEVNITLKYVNIGTTEEFKEFFTSNIVQLCDWVTVEFINLGIKTDAKVTKLVYNVLQNRYDSIEVTSQPKRDTRRDLEETISNQSNTIKNLLAD